MASTCKACPNGNGASWCNGDCTWNSQIEECRPKGIIFRKIIDFSCSSQIIDYVYFFSLLQLICVWPKVGQVRTSHVYFLSFGMAKPIMDVRYFQMIQAKGGVQQKLTPMEIISLAKEIGAIAAQYVQKQFKIVILMVLNRHV